MTTFINLTPHTINVGKSIETVHTFAPSGSLARVDTKETVVSVCPVTGVEVVSRAVGAVIGLPDVVEGIAYIVSGMVLEACKGRSDVFAPDTGSTAVRNERGQIAFVARLVQA